MTPQDPSHMNGPDREATMGALADVLRDALEAGDVVEVSRLGTFETRHQSATLKRQPDGPLTMQPPENTVVFRPASDLS